MSRHYRQAILCILRSCGIYSYSILPALSLDGILHVAVQPKTYTGAAFRTFIDGLLDEMNDYPQPNSVIVMDNASIHKGAELREMIEARYVVSFRSGQP